MSIAVEISSTVLEEDLGPALDDESEGMRMSGHGDQLAVAIYRALERGAKADIRHVLAAIAAWESSQSSPQGSTDLGSASDASDGAAEDTERAQRSLRRAIAELGSFPSRRGYDRWRDRQPDRDELASSTFIRKAHRNSWPEALAAAGAPGPDVTARRLLSNGRAFSLQERQRALRLFAAAVPHGQRTIGAYRKWAHKYVLEPGAVDVPVTPKTFTKHGINWFDVLIDAGLPDEASARTPPSRTGRRRRQA